MPERHAMLTDRPTGSPRLLLVTTVPTTIRAFLLPYADRMRHAGWTVHSLCAPQSAAGGERRHDLGAHFDAVHDAPWARRLGGWQGAWRAVVGLLRAPGVVRSLVRTHRFDVVHVHTPIAAFLTRLALRGIEPAARPRLIYTAHGFHAYAGAGWLRNAVLRSAERFAARWTDYLVVVNRHDHTLARLDRLARHDRLVLHHGIGVDTTRYRPVTAGERAATRRSLDVALDAFAVAMVAEFNANKRQRDVVDALACLASRGTMLPTVLFVGDGPARAAVEAHAARAGVRDHCRFLGTRDDVPALVGACDALVLASAREGLPRCLLEAMSMQVPMVVSSARGATDLAADARGWRYPTGDVVALADLFERLRQDPQAAAERATRARAWVESHASLPRIAALHDTLYARAYRDQSLDVEQVDPDIAALRFFRAPPTVKRAVDVVIAALAIVLLAPVLAAVAAAVRVRLGAPVLFRQQRPGLLGVPFTLVKFRTMRHATDARGHTLPDSARLDPFGRWLRASSLDELPELWNVLRGEMSLVGPRPLLMEYLARYTPTEHRRHDVRPGITGWAQVNGRNAQSWTERFAHDRWYVDHHDLWLDLRILARTVHRVWHRDGISAAGDATMPPYHGPASVTEPG